jgi:Flp pilus assembly pilin Flp
MFQHLVTLVRRTDRTSEGQGLVEYALIIFFVALAVFIALTTLGNQVADLIQLVADLIP